MKELEKQQEAIIAFVKAWDALPKGYHSARAISEWLNSPDLIDAVKRLKKIARSLA